MNKVIITLDSLTYAIKARKILSKKGINSKLVKLDSSSMMSGCTNGIELNSRDFLSAASFLRASGINYSLFNGRL